MFKRSSNELGRISVESPNGHQHPSHTPAIFRPLISSTPADGDPPECILSVHGITSPESPGARPACPQEPICNRAVHPRATRRHTRIRNKTVCPHAMRKHTRV
ncbi:hypothetical protein BD779DRAFT_412198 [Infundibulicybe gibba]|nr:hypothetical protein BD779DRAFT_412198 [Infundibulicybe gibba]